MSPPIIGHACRFCARGSELRKHKRYSPPSTRFVFISERGAPLSAKGFNRMVKRAGSAANLGIKAHAHMLDT